MFKKITMTYTVVVFYLLCYCTVNAVQDKTYVANKGIKGELHSLRGELSSLQSQVNHLEQKNKEQAEVNQQQTEKIQNLKHVVSSSSSCQLTEFACFSKELTLWCFDGGVIEITGAYYGMYSDPCDFPLECCMPEQVDDCRIPVFDNNPSDWLSLKASCDNRTTCSYEYLGSAIDECRLNYLADYIQVYYNCGKAMAAVYDPVGFSAYTLIGHTCDNSVNFGGVISNIGGFYNVNNSSFVCPYRGVYMFSVSVKMTYDGDDGDYDNYLNIFRNNEHMGQVWADGDDVTSLATASGSLIFECAPGQVVWIGCEDSTLDIYGSSSRESIFSGYMLHRYE